MKNNSCDVIIVGAGLAGLNAARKLKNAGLTIKVLEARDRVGGRNLGQHLEDGKVLEMGGQWIGPGHDRMYELCKELNLEVYPAFNEGEVVLYDNGKISLMGSGKDAAPKFDIFSLLALARAVKQVNSMAKTLDLEKPWNNSRAKEWDGETLESWIRKNVWTQKAKDYFRLVSEAVFSTESMDMSFLHFLYYLKSSGGLEYLVGVEEAAQQDRVKGGTQQISIKLAEELGDAVQLNVPITRIEQSENSVKVFSREQYWEGKKVIVCMPPTLAGRLTYDPPLPGMRDQLTQRIPAGAVIKIQVIYKEPFWRKKGLTGQAASFEGPVKIVFDNSLPNDSRGVLVMFMEANDGRKASEWTIEKRREETIKCLVKYFGEHAKDYLEYHERNWIEEEYSRGCYGGHFTPGVWTAYGKYLRKPIGHIHWAGSETAIKWNGYMEGAVLSGERAAAEVIELLS